MKSLSFISAVVYSATFLLLSFSNALTAQTLSGAELLEKAIKYHDPSNNWSQFKGDLKVTMTSPESSPRVSNISINLPQEYFKVIATKNVVQKTYLLDKDSCSTSETESQRGRTPCELATFYKNYYTYLYGLPMKLQDEGTNISEVVERKTFKGKEYLVLKASYDEAVGSDVWYFYFDPETYAMEIYQFFKTENGVVKKDSGEYILLSDVTSINDIKFPKIRAWYFNQDDKYLGTDTLN